MINLGRFDLVSLRLFAAAVEAGSLTRGAERFGISLAAASKRMLELESTTGTPLLVRSKQGVVPSPAGQTLYRHAVKVIADLEQLAVAMGDYGQGVRGHVRLWANTSAVNGFLPGALAAFVAKHPHIKIDLEEALSDAIVRAVGIGVADLGVFGGNTAVAGLQSIVCDVDELVVLTPRGHALGRQRRIRFAKALDHDFIGQDRSASLLRLMSTAADTAGKPLKVRVQVKSFDAMCKMVALGMGIAVLPRTAAEPHIASMGLRQIALDEPWAKRELLLAYRDRATLPLAARTLVEMIEQRAS